MNHTEGEKVDHAAEATTCETRAAEALQQGGAFAAGSIEGVHYAEEASAWAALALSHRTAEQTDQLAHGVLVVKGS